MVTPRPMKVTPATTSTPSGIQLPLSPATIAKTKQTTPKPRCRVPADAKLIKTEV
jgi:hypothetical protein